ncbi:MAG: hypothetical protein Q7S40_25435 [Opitutaceae bacterium]|nr:hypothetical protein [Opitutaceae bacterium]
MVVVAVIGVLAAIAIPAVRKLQQKSRAARFLSDLRTFAQAFETYALQNGRWPADANRGVVPTGMAADFSVAAWTARSTLGNYWDWDYGVNGVTAAISMPDVTVTDAEMVEIDRQIDNGNLNTGNFYKTGTRFIYLLAR